MPGAGARAPVMHSGGKKFVSGNVNVSKPANQKEALQMLNNMMHQRVANKQDVGRKPYGGTR